MNFLSVWWLVMVMEDWLASDPPGSPEHHDQPQEPEEDCEEVEVPVELQCVPGLRS